jgi:hypothetical protein
MGPVQFWLSAASTVFLVLLGIVNLTRLHPTTSDAAIPAVSPTVVPGLDGEPFVAAGHPIGPLGPSGDPVAHRSSALALVGAAYTNVKIPATQLMALPGVPFTFIVPETWGCQAALGTPTRTVHHCADRLAGSGGPGLDLDVERCPASCSEADRVAVEKRLHHQVRQFLDPYVSLGAETTNGRYYLTVVDIFTVSPEEPLGWIVVAQADSASADNQIVQRIVNDIYGQTRV